MISSNAIFQECIFRNIRSISSFVIFSKSFAKFNNCQFKNNEILGNYGAIYLAQSQGLLQNCTFENNKANGREGKGGVISALYYSILTVVKCFFKSNKAKYLGGAIYLYKAILLINGTTFSYNTAEYGGAIFAQIRSNVEVMDCFLKGNVARIEGGAIALILSGGSLFGKNNTFENNSAAVSKYATGGAMFIMGQATVILSWCCFTKNKAVYAGGSITHNAHWLYLESTKFEDNSAVGTKDARDGALYLLSNSVTFHCCHFRGNKASFSGGAIHVIGKNISITNTTLDSNSAVNLKYGSGGAISTRKLVEMTISSCHFKGNKAVLYGGAICLSGKRLHVKNSTFTENIGASAEAQGGALFAVTQSHVEVSYSSFKHNMAQKAGGAISHLKGNLSIKKSSFQTLSYPHGKYYFGGEIIHSSDHLILKDVSMQDMDKQNTHNSLLVHLGEFKDTKISRIRVTCSRGKNILTSSPKESFPAFRDSMIFVTVDCNSCPPHSYSISAGMMGPKMANQTHVRCYNCPFGGNCTNGQIKAADDFWGYSAKMSSNEIRFSTCPFGYCCFGSQCKHYNSCGTGRESTLCGRCRKGLTENIITPNCIKPEECRHIWLSYVLFFGGIAYVLLLFYLKEVASVFITFLIPKQMFLSIRYAVMKKSLFCHVDEDYRNVTSRNLKVPLLSDDTHCELAGYGEMDVRPIDTNEFPEPGYPNKADGSLFPGLLKVIIFFYQASVLFKVYSKGTSHVLTQIIQEVIATLFNVRIDGLFFQDISWCPFHNLNPVPKLLFKTSFILYLFFILLAIFLIFKTSELLKGYDEHTSEAFSSRLFSCALRILLISYATITVTCFNLLSCVDLGPFGKVLFIDGSIHCYNWWQLIVIAVVCIWIASYPIAIYVTSWLLHRNRISTRWFLVSLLLPFAVIIYWIYVPITCRKDNTAAVQLQAKKLLNKNTNEILDVLEGPFRKYHGTGIDNSFRLPWESILIGRRFMLIFVKAFVTNVVIRLYLMQIFSILFLVHHIYVKPFSSNLLNSLETVSLITLIIICGLNMLPAYVYTNPLTISSFTQRFIEIFRNAETVLMLAFPFVIGCCVVIRGLIRILECIIWIFKNCVKLIRLCCKRKTL